MKAKENSILDSIRDQLKVNMVFKNLRENGNTLIHWVMLVFIPKTDVTRVHNLSKLHVRIT